MTFLKSRKIAEKSWSSKLQVKSVSMSEFVELDSEDHNS